MYAYRVVPNSILCKNNSGGKIPLYENAFLGAEDIYYNMGYTSFISDVDTNEKNWASALTTVKTSKENKGKFFFLFPDEALQNASTIINNFGEKFGSTYCLLVYDFPIDIIVQNIGYGSYLGKRREYVLETCVDVNQFGANQMDSADISDINKLNCLKSLFKNSILKEFNDFSQYNIDALLDYALKLGDAVIEQLDDDEWLNPIIRDSQLYKNILNYNGLLIKNNYITGINIPINSFWYNEHTFKKLDKFTSGFLKEYGIDSDINNYDIRDKILEQMHKNPEDKETIGKLLIKR